MPHTDSITPTESHTERYLSSSNPDRCLYAMLAFIGYALSRLLCTTAVRLRTVVWVFSCFCSYLVVSASDRRPPLLYTSTQHQIHTPSVISSCRTRLYPGSKRGSLSPECLWYVSERHVFFNLLIFYTCSCDMIYLHREERDSAVYR